MIARANGLAALSLALVAMGGCVGDAEDSAADDGELDPSAFTAGEIWDSAVGNHGFRVTGSPTGPASPLGNEAPKVSSALLQVVDGGAGGDEAKLVLQVFDGDTEVSAILKVMDAADAGVPGGVAHNVALAGAAAGWEQATATAYLVAAGFADGSIGGARATTSGPDDDDLHRVIAYVGQGIRDDDGSLLAAAEPTDLELHVAFPGSEQSVDQTINGVDDGFLYYYFETVELARLTDTERVNVGEYLIEVAATNEAPEAVARVLVDGESASYATREGAQNLTVTLDGSLSSDADGEIVSWSWQILEFDPTSGDFAEAARLTGEAVEYNFTDGSDPGEKAIRLVVRDDRLGTASVESTFYVNRFTTAASARTFSATTAGGGAECSDLNCQTFQASVFRGATLLQVVVRDNGSKVLQDIHIDLFEPGADPQTAEPSASQSQLGAPVTLNVDEADLTKGLYTIRAWYGAGADVYFFVDVYVQYSPVA